MMDATKVVKQIKDKVRETVVQEKEDWTKAVSEYKKRQELLAKSQEQRVIGFKW
jgi:hypothetical protein